MSMCQKVQHKQDKATGLRNLMQNAKKKSSFDALWLFHKIGIILKLQAKKEYVCSFVWGHGHFGIILWHNLRISMSFPSSYRLRSVPGHNGDAQKQDA